MTESTTSGSASITKQISVLEKKRSALLRLVRATSSLEKLRQSFQAVLQLGATKMTLSTSALKSFESLGRKVRNLPDSEVKVRLGNLDDHVQSNLGRVTEMALQLVDAEEAIDEKFEEINLVVGDFSRYARTSIAMRVLLERRGVKIAPLKISLPVEDIKRRLSRVCEQEKSCRKQAEEQIVSMHEDIGVMLSNPTCTGMQRQVLEAVDTALMDNLEHIQAGKSLADLPTPIEEIELETPRPGAVTKTAEEKESAQEKEQAAKSREAPPHPPEKAKKPSAKQAAQPESSPKRPSGVMGRFLEWLNTPWSVGWKDLRKKKRDTRRK
ncbi:hypothetical protein ONV78_09665 [Hahella sp. CR1]|uniref:hypothetical protein n=1 Tax=Hahella sp. CR1 TaxID=2992807 RepID=UPI002441678F|nr:hypothetical protein [Hahella sp. CR1]MDG9667998.1 hypothetical protein [Hahella sp. CR1]